MKHLFTILLLCFALGAVAQAPPKYDTVYSIHINANGYEVTDSNFTTHKKASPVYSDSLENPFQKTVFAWDETGRVAASKTVTVSDAYIITRRKPTGDLKIRQRDNKGRVSKIVHYKKMRAKK